MYHIYCRTLALPLRPSGLLAKRLVPNSWDVTDHLLLLNAFCEDFNKIIFSILVPKLPPPTLTSLVKGISLEKLYLSVTFCPEPPGWEERLFIFAGRRRQNVLRLDQSNQYLKKNYKTYQEGSNNHGILKLRIEKIKTHPLAAPNGLDGWKWQS